MAGEAYVELAVRALVDAVVAGFTAQLRLIETAESLAPGTIPDPVAYLQARAPWDNRAPLIQIFDEGFAVVEAGQRNKLIKVDCSVILQLTGDADLEALQTLGARYVTALFETIRTNVSLSGRTVGAVITDGDSAPSFAHDHSSTRLIYAVGVEVHVRS